MTLYIKLGEVSYLPKHPTRRLLSENNIWIGLNKLNDTHQVYKWSDGTPTKFLNWDSTQPNEPKVSRRLNSKYRVLDVKFSMGKYELGQLSKYVTGILGWLRLHGLSTGDSRRDKLSRLKWASFIFQALGSTTAAESISPNTSFARFPLPDLYSSNQNFSEEMVTTLSKLYISVGKISFAILHEFSNKPTM